MQQEDQRKVNVRVKVHRERKKRLASAQSTSQIEPTESPIGSYNSSRSFGKAVNKVKHRLPNSPNKKTVVLKKLVADVIGPYVLVNTTKQKVKHVDLTVEKKSMVEEFFCCDDISRQAPGMKDVITVRKQGGKKEKVQKRILVMTIPMTITRGACHKVYSESDSSDEESNNAVVGIYFSADDAADFQEKDFVVVVYKGEHFQDRSMFFDEDGDLAHEFYEEVRPNKKGSKAKMKRIQTNLVPQGEVPYQCPRLHSDYPVILHQV